VAVQVEGTPRPRGTFGVELELSARRDGGVVGRADPDDVAAMAAARTLAKLPAVIAARTPRGVASDAGREVTTDRSPAALG
jgi:hypothetical protein